MIKWQVNAVTIRAINFSCFQCNNDELVQQKSKIICDVSAKKMEKKTKKNRVC